MTKLIHTRGYSGSGKSFWASLWLSEDVDNRIVLNRDDLRASMFSSEGVLSFDKEKLITQVQRAAAKAALEAGKDVCISDTGLKAKFLKDWADFAADMDAEFEVRDFPTDVETCVRQNNERADGGGRLVPERVIRNQAKRFPAPWPTIKARPLSRPVVEPYEAAEDLPGVILCDIDGTVADMTRCGRSPFDETRVSEDDPHWDIIEIVQLLNANYPVIFFSGRSERCYDDTLAWLEDHGLNHDGLFMRPAGDGRPDFEIKLELFNKHIRDQYRVVAVIDDRLQVARLWFQLGLPLLRVGDPDSAF